MKAVLVRTTIPLSNADHAARCVWSTDNVPRVALSFRAVVNTSNNNRSCKGALLAASDLKSAAAEFYNSLEAPVLEKYPLLAIFQDFLRTNGAAAALMSGSGSTTFAVVREGEGSAQRLAEKLKGTFGCNCWTAVVPI